MKALKLSRNTPCKQVFSDEDIASTTVSPYPWL